MSAGCDGSQWLEDPSARNEQKPRGRSTVKWPRSGLGRRPPVAGVRRETPDLQRVAYHASSREAASSIDGFSKALA